MDIPEEFTSLKPPVVPYLITVVEAPPTTIEAQEVIEDGNNSN